MHANRLLLDFVHFIHLCCRITCYASYAFSSLTLVRLVTVGLLFHFIHLIASRLHLNFVHLITHNKQVSSVFTLHLIHLLIETCCDLANRPHCFANRNIHLVNFISNRLHFHLLNPIASRLLVINLLRRLLHFIHCVIQMCCDLVIERNLVDDGVSRFIFHFIHLVTSISHSCLINRLLVNLVHLISIWLLSLIHLINGTTINRLHFHFIHLIANRLHLISNLIRLNLLIERNHVIKISRRLFHLTRLVNCTKRNLILIHLTRGMDTLSLIRPHFNFVHLVHLITHNRQIRSVFTLHFLNHLIETCCSLANWLHCFTSRDIHLIHLLIERNLVNFISRLHPLLNRLRLAQRHQRRLRAVQRASIPPRRTMLRQVRTQRTTPTNHLTASLQRRRHTPRTFAFSGERRVGRTTRRRSLKRVRGQRVVTVIPTACALNRPIVRLIFAQSSPLSRFALSRGSVSLQSLLLIGIDEEFRRVGRRVIHLHLVRGSNLLFLLLVLLSDHIHVGRQLQSPTLQLGTQQDACAVLHARRVEEALVTVITDEVVARVLADPILVTVVADEVVETVLADPILKTVIPNEVVETVLADPILKSIISHKVVVAVFTDPVLKPISPNKVLKSVIPNPPTTLAHSLNVLAD